jgi:hypothetical protein
MKLFQSGCEFAKTRYFATHSLAERQELVNKVRRSKPAGMQKSLLRSLFCSIKALTRMRMEVL